MSKNIIKQASVSPITMKPNSPLGSWGAFCFVSLLLLASAGYSNIQSDRGTAKAKIETKKSCVKACQAPSRKSKNSNQSTLKK